MATPGIAGGRIQIAVACCGLRERTRFSWSPRVACIVYMKSRGGRTWKEMGRTELIENTLEPEWSKTFLLDYYFEEKQCIKFSIFDWTQTESNDPYEQEPLGTCEATLAEIVARGGDSQSGRFERALSPYQRRPGDSGVLICYSEEQSQVKDSITFQFSGSNLDKCDVFSESDPFFTVSKTNPDGSDTIVYRSDYIKDNANPDWPPVTMTSVKLCNGDYERPLKVEIWDFDDNGHHDFIGEFLTNVNEMTEGEGFQIVIWDVINKKKAEKATKKGEYINSGQVILKAINLEQKTTFLDYIRGGTKLHFVVAIDFTQSNGKPTDPGSLHYIDGHRVVENPYTMAIRTIGEIFQDYDPEKRFLSLGFGGMVNGRTSHCFPLNGNSRDPYCYGIEGIIDAYYSSLEHVPLSDPTWFAPVINYVKSIAEHMKNDPNNYLVLLIITDGGIEDMDDTKKLLVDAANFSYPLSIILVGLTSKDKEKRRNMNLLDGDTKALSYRNQKAKRDIVQFVEMSRYIPEGSMNPQMFQSVMESSDAKYMLAKDMLAEIPIQVTEYMNERNFKPNIPDVSMAMKFQDMTLR